MIHEFPPLPYPRNALEPIMSARFEMCAQKGFDAVEPDNMEAYANASGFPLTASDQLAYNQWVAQTVHALGMAVLQKNDGEQTQQQVKNFDGALAEQCYQYHECSDYMLYLQADKPVLNAELIANTADDEIEYILQGARARVKRGHGGKHDSPGFGTDCQIAELDGVQRRLARYQDQPAMLFEMNIGGTVDEVLRQAMCDSSNRTHAARAHDHAGR